MIEEGTVLEDIMAHPHVKELLASMHTGPWFKVEGAAGHLNVQKGGRQGCKFGGILFNLSYAKALKKLYESAKEENIPLKLRYHKGAAPGGDDDERAEDQVDSEAILFDATFVDDEAIVIVAVVPTTLSTKFNRAVQLLVHVFRFYGMEINWKAGTTEAIMVYMG